METTDLEFINCNLCHSDNYKVLYKAKPHKPYQKEMFYPTSISLVTENIVKCQNCGLIFTNPRLKPDLLRRLYYEGEDKNYIEQQEERIKIFQKVLKFIETFCPSGNMLDIGCAAGFLLYVAKKRHWRAKGIELNRFFADFANLKLNVDVINGNVEEIDFKSNSFDIIVMWDALEHLTDPYLVLSKAYSWLKNDGYIFINIPNKDSIFAKILKNRCWFMTSMHLYHFSPTTIKIFFKKVGFKFLTKKRHIQHLKIDYLITKIMPYSNKFYNIIDKLTKIMRLQNVIIPYYAGQITIVGQK